MESVSTGAGVCVSRRVVYVKDARNGARSSEGLQEEPLRVTHCMSQHSHTVEK